MSTPTMTAPRKSLKGDAPPPKSKAVDELKTGRDATVTVPRWDRFVAGGEAAGGGSFGEAVEMHEGAAWTGFCREFFSKLYGSGGPTGPAAIKPEERPEGAEWVEKLHDMAESLPEWRTLKERARRDQWACGIAAGEGLKVLGQQVTPPKVDPQAIADELDFVKDMMASGKTSPQHLRRMAALQKDLQTAQQDHAAAARLLTTKAASIRSAIRAGAMKGLEAINDMEEAMAGIAAGEGTGIASRANVPPAELRKVLSSNKKLRRIAMLAGRMKHAAIHKQRTKAKIGREEICDVAAGSDITRLLPVELGMLANDDTEALLFRKLNEGAALQYDMRGKAEKKEGPIILCVDESGSMNGAPDEWSKAVLFGLMEVAARQKRPVFLAHFDSSVTRVDEFRDPRNVTLEAIVNCVTHFTGGGTSIGAALGKAATIMESEDGPWKRADVVLITDGEDYEAESQKRAIARIKARGGHLYYVAIGIEPGGLLKAEADESVHLCSEDIQKGDTSKVSAVFGI